jgi:hypothetical protein
MKVIKEETNIKKRKIEKSISLYLASFIAALIFGYYYQFSFLVTAVFIFSLINVFILLYVYAEINELEKIMKQLEKKIKDGEINEVDAIVEIAKYLKK